jgi:predicted Zn-dependent protease
MSGLGRVRALERGTSTEENLVERPVLSRDAMLAIGHKLLGMVRDSSFRIRIEHSARAVTRIADGRVLSTDDGDRIIVTFDSEFGSGIPVEIHTNQLDDATLRRVVTVAESLAPPKRPPADVDGDDLDDPQYFTFQSQPIPSAALWYAPTVRAMASARGETIPRLADRLRGSGLVGAATVGIAARSVLYLYKQGLTAFAEETDAEVTVTARTPDGGASGWSGEAHRNWSQIHADRVADRAVQLAQMGRNRVGLEPGRRTVILGPTAVAQLIQKMAQGFKGRDTRMGFTPFSANENGRRTKVGLRVFDPRIDLVSDPDDPVGGYPPFFEPTPFGLESRIFGYPMRPMAWIEQGVLKNLAYDVLDGNSRRLVPSEMPLSIRLSASAGTALASIDEMITQCKDGVYINRFSEVDLVDPRMIGFMTGVTRDGCFYVKDGKIVKPVKNFRFLDSPYLAFTRVEMIGASQRVAFGYKGIVSELSGRWPQLPVIAPPMMIRDFNLVATADAV